MRGDDAERGPPLLAQLRPPHAGPFVAQQPAPPRLHVARLLVDQRAFRCRGAEDQQRKPHLDYCCCVHRCVFCHGRIFFKAVGCFTSLMFRVLEMCRVCTWGGGGWSCGRRRSDRSKMW